MSIDVQPGERPGKVAVATKVHNSVHYPVYISGGIVSNENSSTTALNDSETFTGEWEDVGMFNSVVVAVKTDQNGTFTVQFSPDGVNADSTLTRYYRTTQIEAPHKFIITRKYCRITFTNNSGTNQTYFRLQTMFGDKGDLNAPCDSTLAQDFDAIVTRPTDFRYEATLGRRQGTSVWNKFGYNADVDAGASEIVAAFGGAYTVNTTASTIDIVSSSTDDDDGGTGTNSVVVYGIDENWDETIEVVTMDGTTTVTTTSQWIGINRVAMYLCGTGQVNAGTITITATTGGRTMATMPIGEGVSQQCLFFVPRNHQFLIEWGLLGAARQAAQNPKVTFKFWVYSTVNNGNQEVLRKDVNTAVDVSIPIEPKLPFPIGEKSILWLEASTDRDDTSVTGRFSGILFRDVDA